MSSKKKKHWVRFSLADLYAIRNALRQTDEAKTLEKVEKMIKDLHSFFDGKSKHEIDNYDLWL
ncbi:hypothetical protein [Anaerovibrio sp. RM50]|uniref:hypothetical protein n=1 Tax=Anaerovibrio sp. RM50 TaxID=1200557 RepID=UPI000483A9FF|nr:hypothetical protein [Anaerovibrio sp. RM50]